MAVLFSVQTSPVGQAVPRHSGPNEKVTQMDPAGHEEQPVLYPVDASCPQATPAPGVELPVQDARRDKHTIHRQSAIMRSSVRLGMGETSSYCLGGSVHLRDRGSSRARSVRRF